MKWRKKRGRKVSRQRQAGRAGVGEPKFRFRSGELNWVNFAAEPNFPPTLSSRLSSSPTLFSPSLPCFTHGRRSLPAGKTNAEAEGTRATAPLSPFRSFRCTQGWECPNADTDTRHYNWTSFFCFFLHFSTWQIFFLFVLFYFIFYFCLFFLHFQFFVLYFSFLLNTISNK